MADMTTPPLGSDAEHPLHVTVNDITEDGTSGIIYPEKPRMWGIFRMNYGSRGFTSRMHVRKPRGLWQRIANRWVY